MVVSLFFLVVKGLLGLFLRRKWVSFSKLRSLQELAAVLWYYEGKDLSTGNFCRPIQNASRPPTAWSGWLWADKRRRLGPIIQVYLLSPLRCSGQFALGSWIFCDMPSFALRHAIAGRRLNLKVPHKCVDLLRHVDNLCDIRPPHVLCSVSQDYCLSFDNS